MRDAGEFDAFYTASSRRVLGQVYAMTGNRAEAEDAVAEAYLKAWDRKGRMTYAIGFGRDPYGNGTEGYLAWDPQGTQGLVVQQKPRADLQTTWVFIDRGPSTLAE